VPATSTLKNFASFILQDRFSSAGLVIVVSLILIALTVPYMNLPNPISTEFPRFAPPSREHPLGTDSLGRDLLSRVLWGTRTSLMVGFIAAGLASLIGMLLGSLAGLYGGLVDAVISRIMEVFLLLPTFFLALLIVAVYGSSIYNVMAVIGFTMWTTTARIARAQTLVVRELPYVEAARAVGASRVRILVHYVLPQVIPLVLAYMVLLVGNAILIEAALSYIGLGDPNLPSWGRIIYEGQPYIFTAWWISLFPGILLTLTVLGFNMLGDALNRYLNPKIRVR